MKRSFEAWRGVLRAGFASAIAYRAEFVVWFLSTNMPLVMWLLFSAVAAEAPVGRYGPKEFGAYFLMTLIVRMLSGAWVAWQLNEEVRQGLLAQRLMRPLHPFLAFAGENLAAFPLRIMMLLPVFAFAALSIGAAGLTHSPLQLALGVVSVAMAWALQFAAQLVIGTLALFWHHALSLLDLWVGCFFVFSGYLMPLELLPAWMQAALRYTPFPYVLGHSVEALLGLVTLEQTLRGCVFQLAYVVGLSAFALALFQLGLKRFQAFGG